MRATTRTALLALGLALGAGCRRRGDVEMELDLAGKLPYPGWQANELYSDESAVLLVSGPLIEPSWQTLGDVPFVERLDARSDAEPVALQCEPAKEFLRSLDGWRSMRKCTVPSGLSVGEHVIRPIGDEHEGRFVIVVRRPPLRGLPRAREYRQACAAGLSAEEVLRRATLLRDHVVADPRAHPGELEVALALMGDAAAGVGDWGRAAGLYESAAARATRPQNVEWLRGLAADCRARAVVPSQADGAPPGPPPG